MAECSTAWTRCCLRRRCSEITRRGASCSSNAMHIRAILIFACIQIAGVVAMHLGPDWSLVLGVALLLPGTGLYIFTGIHKLMLIGDIRLALMTIIINAAVWQCIALAVRKQKTTTPTPTSPADPTSPQN